MTENLRTIRTFSSEIEAEIARNQLEGSGIPAFIVKDVCGSMYPNLQLVRGIELKVRVFEENAARDVLRGFTLAAVPDTNEIADEDDIQAMKMMEAKNLAKKAFFLLIISFGTLPGIVALPMAFNYSKKALELIRGNNISSSLLKAGILAVIFLTVLLFVFYFLAAIYYLRKKYWAL